MKQITITDLAEYRSAREAARDRPWRCPACGFSSFGADTECPGADGPCGAAVETITQAELDADLAELAAEVLCSEDPDLQAEEEVSKPERVYKAIPF